MERMYKIGLGVFATLWFVAFAAIGVVAWPLLKLGNILGEKVRRAIGALTAQRAARDAVDAVVDAPAVFQRAADAL